MSAPRTAIVVITYQSERFLDALCASLAAHTDPNQVCLVVVDNASSDGTRAALPRLLAGWPHHALIELPHNRGFAGGCNAGMAEARRRGAELALLLNPDTEVTPGWLPPLIAALDADPRVAAAQPLLLLHGTDRLNTAGNVLHFCGFGYCGHLGQPVAALGPLNGVRPVTYATGAALLLRLSACAEIGDFDELLFLYHEDCDLQIRLRQHGWQCVLVPGARVYHKYAADFSPRKYYWLERNRWLVLLKTWPADLILLSAPVLAGVELAVLAFAARGGWLREKLDAYREVLRHAPSWLHARRDPGADRHAIVPLLSGEMVFEGLDHPLVTRLANPLLRLCWRGLRSALKWTHRTRAHG
jgi:hypothetical protein